MAPHPLASAVVLPSPSPPHTSPAPAPKRPHDSSLVQAPTSPKRRRLSAAEDVESRDTRNQKPRATGEESRDRKRTQRLFGGLLCPLPATTASSRPKQSRKPTAEPSSTSTQQSHVADVQGPEEAREARLARLATLTSERRIRQRRVDKRNLEIKHANMRALAGFLKTEAEPVVFWRPALLNEKEEERVKKERERVEGVIKGEVEGFERGGEVREEGEGDGMGIEDRPGVSDGEAGAMEASREGEVGADEGGAEVKRDPRNGGAELVANEKMVEKDASVTVEQAAHVREENEIKGSLDETGDVVVEGEEDTVIY